MMNSLTLGFDLASEEGDDIENLEVMTWVAFELEALKVADALRATRQHDFCARRLDLIEARESQRSTVLVLSLITI